MAKAGCIVHLYDPHADLDPNPGENIFFKKVGLAHKTGEMSLRVHQNASVLHKTNKLSKTTMPVKFS